MNKIMEETLCTVGSEIVKNEKVQAAAKTTGKGLVGLGAIGAGTVLETVGAGTAVGSVGYAITGAGCAATQALMTGAATALPGALGTTVASGIGATATGIFTVVSSPVVLGGAAIAGAGYGIYKFIKWVNE